PNRYRRLVERLHYAAVFASIDWKALMRARGLLDALDVEYVAAPLLQAPTLLEAGLEPVRTTGYFELFENPKRRGHAWVNHAVQRVPSEGAALDRVLDATFDPREAAVVEDDTRGQYPERTRAAVTALTSEHRASFADVEYSVKLDRPGLLVASE